jgi:hypothetical protein
MENPSEHRTEEMVKQMTEVNIELKCKDKTRLAPFSFKKKVRFAQGTKSGTRAVIASRKGPKTRSMAKDSR